MFSLKANDVVLIAISIVSLLDYCVALNLSKGVCRTQNIFPRTREFQEPDNYLVCCENYEYDSELDQCVPICSQGCVHGYCSEPNKCKCNDGYKVDPNDGNNCIPIYDLECVNGSSKDNECISNEGYVKTENNSVCKPFCVGCDFGHCVAPNNCSCFEGYERTNLTCKPKCSACGYEDCVAPETCISSTTRPLLEESYAPTCSPPCSNENCLIPNQCFCNKHFDLMCSVICNHGYCSPPGNCTCKPKKKGKLFRF